MTVTIGKFILTIQNLLNFLNESPGVERVYCFSTFGKLNSVEFGRKIKVFRLGKVGGHKLTLWMTYLYYNLASIVFLLTKL